MVSFVRVAVVMVSLHSNRTVPKVLSISSKDFSVSGLGLYPFRVLELVFVQGDKYGSIFILLLMGI